MRIAVIAKYSFYFEDIQNELHNLNIEMVYAEDISQIEQLVAGGMPFEYIFFPHYSKVIPGGFLQLHSCIGFHTGDLPADRGGSPIQHKILKGEYKTWVSAINLIEEIDAGDVLCQEPVSLEHGSIEAILKRISKIIARLVHLVLVENPRPIPQKGNSAPTPRLKPSDSELDLGSLNVRQIYDRIRMLDGLDYPPAYLDLGRYRIHLSDAEFQENSLTFVSHLKENNS
jgi:methionyl-tRNA formyltransferase